MHKLTHNGLKTWMLRLETIQLLEENICKTVSDIGLSSIFLAVISSGKGKEKKNYQMGLHQNKELLHSKGNHHQNKRQPIE